MRICLHDKERIRAYLRQNTALNLYKIGDLDPFFWNQTLWYGWFESGSIQAVALVYTGESLPVLLLMENHEAAGKLLRSMVSLLPANFYAHLRPEMEKHLPNHLKQGGDTYFRMMQKSENAREVALQNSIILQPENKASIEAFYALHYPDNWFNPHMLHTQNYIAIQQNKQILAIAGVHVFSEKESLAALGNIAVHTDWRGQGLGQQITNALCVRLRKKFGIAHIGLNVNTKNTKAQTCYHKLGFENVATYKEWTFNQLN